MTYKLFVDTNVYLDVMLQRGEDWQNAERIFTLAETGQIEVYTSSSSLINIMYIMSKYKLDKQTIVRLTKDILSYSRIINTDNIGFEIALSSDFEDLEDAVQYYTALEIKGGNFFITSNVKDFKHAHPMLSVIKPGAFLKHYNNNL